MNKGIRVLKIATILMLAFAFAFSGTSQAFAENAGHGNSVAKTGDGVYVVRMADEPVVAYEGGIQGYKATKPEHNQKIDPFSDVVVKYVGYLNGRHDAALNAVGGGQKLYDYTYSFNGFAAQLTPEQAIKMESVAGVLSVSADEIFDVDTSSTPTFLGLDAVGGLWDQLGGVGSAGDGIIIGLIDSGIWPESASFSDRTGLNGNETQDGKLDYQQIPGWHGKCVPGEEFNASLCNQKLIGAQYFNASWGGDAGIDAQRPWEFNSVRDYNGHGTHTSSTAGGNNGVVVTGPAAVFGTISGIAPHARIAMYKALWSTQDASTASGSTSDLVAAIDQAVADGVDVINYSISGTQTNFRDPVEIAFLYAADAGIFVAASAGNSGPTTSTVAHPSPWITTVAAGTHNRVVTGSVTLGNGATYTGVSLAAAAVGPAPLIDSVAAGLPGADPTQVALCYSSLDGGNVLDPAKVAGKIVICQRGVTARVNKSLAVLEAGGIGLVLYNDPDSTLNADFHSVPTVHVDRASGLAIKAYAATPGATATINQATISYTAPAPYTASFSSRGPLIAGNGDLLKPDVIAPGQDILAAVSPASGPGLDFNLYSGTSMSSPHVAGLAALLMDLHPDWTPMMIKSALMTSAYDILDGPNTHPLVIFRQGAGHVRPNSAADPGLVYNSGWNDWFGFLCGTQLPTYFCANMGIDVIDPSNFNTASIAIGDLAGVQTVTRTVTNVGGKETYTFSYSGLAGITVAPSISSFTINPGASQDFDVTFTTAGAALNAYVGGYITWTGDKGHVVRVPVVIKPVALAAPVQVSGSYGVTFGYTGPFTATARGLIPAVTGDDEIYTGESRGYTVVIPAGVTYARFSLFDANVSPASDLDLYVYRGSTLVGSSGGGTSSEEVNLLNPTAATYTVVVDGYATGNPSTFTLFYWLLGSTAAGNMTVSAPSTATTGATGTINLTFSGLTPGVKYLGSIAYSGAAGMPNPTIVRVDP
ncbi:subtilase family [Longilinea arvoryzae]|uniref:Subtilase family n=1 Tax=Longilinea arvoryzae TaxID=360412 RepID=A0A0S7BBK5_9CHLR|nr:S8 family peptidase [Longilinea arvoryzae]GAP15063.1 subtilase family [Longilinea arvoryzae]